MHCQFLPCIMTEQTNGLFKDTASGLKSVHDFQYPRSIKLTQNQKKSGKIE
jgi:hypothetical protein